MFKHIKTQKNDIEAAFEDCTFVIHVGSLVTVFSKNYNWKTTVTSLKAILM